jgi:hypothetical protein
VEQPDRPSGVGASDECEAGDMAQPGYWDEVYRRSAATDVSWFQPEPTVSLELIAMANVALADPIIDVGGGASALVDRLLDAGHEDVTVLDVAADVLGLARRRLGPRSVRASWIVHDLLTWRPDRRYRIWHDRAVFHFLTEHTDRDQYRAVLRHALSEDGRVVIATFAADGPTTCSGLPTARYSPDELADQFPDLKVVETRREEHLTPAGHLQPFTWLLMNSR